MRNPIAREPAARRAQVELSRPRKRTKQIRRSAARRPDAAWRSAPATDEQLAVLRKIATDTGRTFADSITRGEASELIADRFNTDPKAARAHRKAERKRRQLDQRLVNPAANWKYGYKQTPEQEQAEIRKAQRDGLGEVYMALQAWTHARRSEAAT